MENTYRKGDYVRYASDGVCVVAGIEAMASMDRRSVKRCYVLRPVADSGTKIFVPLDNPVLLGRMHAVLTREEIDDAIRESAAHPLEWIADRAQRAQCFRDILKAPEPLPLLRLCCCIHGRRIRLSGEGKRLSGSDEAVLKQAERLVESEFSFSLGIPRQEVGPYIHALWTRAT